MKQFKKLLSVLLCLSILFAMAIPAHAAEVFEIDENGVLKSYNGQAARVVIPEGVTEIGRSAFSNKSFITELTLPSTLTKIHTTAFYGLKKLERIVIPQGVTEIGESAFTDCKALKEVILPDSVEKIGAYAFNYTALMDSLLSGNNGMAILGGHLLKYDGPGGEVVVPQGVKSISDRAFDYCTDVTAVTLPEGLLRIGQSAFNACAALETIRIPDTVAEIGSEAFRSCEKLTAVTLPDRLTVISGDLFRGCSALESVTVPETVTAIGGYAFYRCTNLERVELPQSVTSVGNLAFGYCDGITDIFVPYTVSQIDNSAFYGCYNATFHVAPESAGETMVKDQGFMYVVDMPAAPAVEEPAEEEPAVSFEDVPGDAYYTQSVAWAVSMGITTGKTATQFQPNGDCTRAQIAAFLWRANGCPEPVSGENPFTDVSESAYYYKAVLWAVEQGITTGKTADTFAPNAPCTRAQVVTFLWRAAGRPEAAGENPFGDIQSGAYYYDAVLWAVEQGITTGKTATTFQPAATCTRGQIVTFLFRALA